MKGRRISRRTLIIEGAAMAGGLTAAVLLAGCAPQPTAVPAKQAEATKPPATQPPKAAAEQIVLRWQVRAGIDGQWMYKLFDQFMQKYPNIKIEGEDVPHNEASMKTELGFAAGDLPDVLHCHTRWLKIGCYKGFYLTIDDLLQSTDAVPDYKDFFPLMVENAKFEGKTYCIGENAHTSVAIVLMWNRGLIEQAGAKPPSSDMTYQELQELIIKCSNPEKGIFGAQLQTSSQARKVTHLRTWGEPKYGAQGDTSSWLTSSDGRKFQFLDNVAAKEWYGSWFARLLKERAHPKTEDLIQEGLFPAQRCAIFQAFPGYLRIWKNAIGDKWDFHTEDACILPKGEKGRLGTAQEEDSKCVWSKSKHPEEALRSIGYVLSFDGAMVAKETSGPWTARRSVLSDPKMVEEYPILKEVVAVWDSGNVEPYPMPYNLRDPEFSDLQAQLIQPMLEGTATWEEQAPIAQKQIQNVFDLPRP